MGNIVHATAISTFCGSNQDHILWFAQNSQNVVQRSMSTNSKSYPEIAERLIQIRAVFGKENTQKEWAEKHGFNSTQVNNWEKGLRRIPVDSAEKLCETYGLTLDFIYRGRRDGLSERAAKVL
ncbi:helix-turn-helix domain-containing protein [Pseudophaeobacter arcticus]